ncbi:MAG: xanthine dehydrogenase family protein molybdopterin-binding subunit [Proteobacteria bacterium]|nr:xanthine dehydrogenase family protein molybdopterin-binding subunit [Pseudomonadota bacterium]
MPALIKLKRRDFLRGATAGLLLGFAPGSARAAGPASLGPWILIGVDGVTTLFVEKSEMGQGIHTALPMLLAEELDVDWQSVRVAFPVQTGPSRPMSTGASSSVRKSFEPLRQAGAAAREMLVRAGAEALGVPAGECQTAEGHVLHPASGRRVAYADVSTRAEALAVPERPRLKDPAAFRLIGRSVPRVDVPAKVAGSARFGIDVRVKDMLYGAVSCAPAGGGALQGFDREAALAVTGVREVVELPDGIAVLADHYWQARRGLDAARPAFSAGGFDSDAFAAKLRAELETAGVTASEHGGPAAHGAVASRVEADYEVPFLAHLTMEPQNCTVDARPDGCEVWAPTQAQKRLRESLARELELPVNRVRLHTTYLGGGFGRRFEPDAALQAARASRAVGRPVQILWSREEDVRHDYYRPAFAARLWAELDAEGWPISLRQRIAGPHWEARDSPLWLQGAGGWLQRQLDAGLVPDALPDAATGRLPYWLDAPASRVAVEGADRGFYAIPHQRVEYTSVPAALPIGWWRSVGNSQTAFFVESFLDEIAHAGGKDPLALRRHLLSGDPRRRRVLETAVAAAGWDAPPGAGRGRGLALHTAFETTVCQVAEVSAGDGDEFRVDRIVCAVDCGTVVHPDTVRAQMEGGTLFGLSGALFGKVDVRDGAVAQSNFHDYRILGLAEAPRVEVHLLESDARPGGVGEPGTPPVAPAVANALYAATGRRARSLPLLPGARG